MTMRHLKPWLICCVLLVPLAVIAEPPGGGRRSDRNGSERDRFGDRQGGFMRSPGEWSPEEWKQFRSELDAFCKQNSPNRWKEFESHGRGGGDKGRGRFMALVQRFRYLQTLKKQDPELYDIQVSQIRVEDAEYGKIVELKDVDPNDKQKIEELKGDLRAKNKEYVALRLKERAHRIDRLAKLIEKERQALANDSDAAAQERMVDQRLEEMMSQGADFFNPRPRRGDGDGGSTTSPSNPRVPGDHRP